MAKKVSKKVAEAIAEVKEATEKVAKAAEPTLEKVAKVTETVVEEVKKAAEPAVERVEKAVEPVAEKAVEAAKEKAGEVVKKASARKTAKMMLFIEMNQMQVKTADIESAVKKDMKAKGLKGDLVQIYLNCAEGAAYYTVDGVGHPEYKVCLKDM